MDYRIVVTEQAERDLDSIIRYLVSVLYSKQSARSVLEDYENTLEFLSRSAGSIKLCDNPNLKKMGYRRINLQFHRYYLMYRIDEDIVYVEGIFHNLQDLDNKIK